MGNSCTCIKDGPDVNEVETFGFKGAKLHMIIIIQKNWRGHQARKRFVNIKEMKGLTKVNAGNTHAGFASSGIPPSGSAQFEEDLYSK